MKKWMCICAAAVLTISALAGCDANAGAATVATQIEASKEEVPKTEMAKRETIKTSEASEKAGDTASEEVRAAVGKHHVKINAKDYGAISTELYGNEAPITVANFLKLAKDGFYNGLTFHHIISGFMIQGGDPLGTSTGGSDQEVKGEFSNNGVENPLSHTRRATSTAHSQIKNSASSQFFTMHEDNTFLDRDYARFGYVTKGMEVMNAIRENIKVKNNNDFMTKANQPVIESVEVVD